jgi:hypothetical protein
MQSIFQLVIAENYFMSRIINESRKKYSPKSIGLCP